MRALSTVSWASCSSRWRSFSWSSALTVSDRIVHDVEILSVIGEEQDGEIDAGLVDGELGFLLVALAVVQLELGLDGIGVGHFPAFFLLLGDVEELLGVANALARVGKLARGDGHAVVILHDGGDEAAGGEIGLGARSGSGGHGAVRHTLAHCRAVFETEANSAVD